MKTKWIITMSLLLLSLCFSACSHDDEEQNGQDTCLLVGKWVKGEGELNQVRLYRSDGTGYLEFISEGELLHFDFTYTWEEKKDYSLYEGYGTAYTVWYDSGSSEVPDLFIISKDGKHMLSPFDSSLSHYERQ